MMPCHNTASSLFYLNATAKPRPPPPWGALPPVSPPPINPLGTGPTAAEQPPYLGRAVGGCAIAYTSDGRVRYGKTTFCYVGARAAHTPLYNPLCPKFCDNRCILSPAIIMIIVWGKGESGKYLSSANSLHRPRGGLCPPCPLPPKTLSLRVPRLQSSPRTSGER